MVAVHDTNSKNGFYACVIETSPGNAVICFRGSEGLEAKDGYQNLKNDWMQADLGLLNATQTTQQAEVDRFLEQNRELLDQYDITMTGHSLGGNLAEYAAVKMREHHLDDNLEECVSLDGPGFSNEFIEKYRGEIDHISSKLKHYRWSLVGGLLNELPGVQPVDLAVQDVSENDRYNSFTRHDTKYLTFDENGKFKTGDLDKVAIYAREFSLKMDGMDKWKGDLVKNGLISFSLTIAPPIYAARDFFGFVKDTADKIKDFFSGDNGGGGGGGGSAGGRGGNGGGGGGGGGSTGGRGGFTGSGGSHSFGGRSADVIKVSTEEMADTVRRYEHEKSRLMDALEICNNAAQMLARSWAGPSFLEMSVRMANTYKNLKQSLDQLEDAISELNQVIQIMEKTENQAISIASSLEAGESPFA